MTGILKKVGRGEEPRNDSSHVMVKNAGCRMYKISGSSVENEQPLRFASQNFANLNEAIEVAMDWAEIHKIEFVHVVTSDE